MKAMAPSPPYFAAYSIEPTNNIQQLLHCVLLMLKMFSLLICLMKILNCAIVFSHVHYIIDKLRLENIFSYA